MTPRRHEVTLTADPSGGTRCTCTCGWTYTADPSSTQHWFEAALARSAHILASAFFEGLGRTR